MELISYSKTSRIEEWLLKSICNEGLKPGDKILSEQQLIRKFDVSRITVTRALKNLEGKGVLRRRQGQGTFVKSIDFIAENDEFSAFETRSRHLKIGCLYFYSNPEDSINLENNALHFSTFMGASKEAEKCNCSLEMRNIEDTRNIDAAKSKISNYDWDGIILVSASNETTQAIAELEIPTVIYGGICHEKNINYVLADNEFGGAELTKYLLDNGHKDIAFVTIDKNSNFRYRYQGFCREFSFNGLKIDPEMLFYYNGVDSVNDLILKKKPTAIFAANDSIAVEIAISLYKLGLKIPDDISLVGFDNDPAYTSLFPDLTTMEVPYEELGKHSIELLAKQCRTDCIRNIKIMLPTKLIERSSVRKIIQ